jgi:hypothetical protein
MISLPYTIFLSLAFIFTFFTNDSIAMDASVKATLPLSYKIEEVRISLTRRPGNPSFPIQRLTLSGSGNATLERDSKSTLLSYSDKDLLSVLKEFYKIRFFDLPEDYSTEYSVFLDKNRIIQTTALRLPDVESTSACLAVAGYKKCVTYSRKGPLELENLVQRIFAKVSEVR